MPAQAPLLGNSSVKKGSIMYLVVTGDLQIYQTNYLTEEILEGNDAGIDNIFWMDGKEFIERQPYGHWTSVESKEDQ